MPQELPIRVGLFVAIFASLLCIIGLSFPVPYGPRAVTGTATPTLLQTPICLRLRYEGSEDDELPGEMRLRSAAGLGPGLYAADGGPESMRLYNYSSWRPAGRDSIDVGWHHSPVLRLPVAGDSLIGRGAWAGLAPLVEQLVTPKDFRVIARRYPCTKFIAPAS